MDAGWTIVGKKDTCPVCLEKVDLRSIFADRPWETRNLNWNQMLDMVHPPTDHLRGLSKVVRFLLPF